MIKNKDEEQNKGSFRIDRFQDNWYFVADYIFADFLCLFSAATSERVYAATEACGHPYCQEQRRPYLR